VTSCQLEVVSYGDWYDYERHGPYTTIEEAKAAAEVLIRAWSHRPIDAWKEDGDYYELIHGMVNYVVGPWEDDAPF
jgi:hypothetical protein